MTFNPVVHENDSMKKNLHKTIFYDIFNKIKKLISFQISAIEK